MKRIIATLLLTTTLLCCSGFTNEPEYETATIVWDYLQELGYNDYVCAGILGNMMVESGGYTLNIDPSIETKSFYGICQWSRRYYPDVIGVSLDAQCNYLRDTIKNEIDTFGFLYSKKFNYDQFLTIEDEKDAALAFAKSYERCGSESYEKRQECATVAYDFFTAKCEETLAQLQPQTTETKMGFRNFRGKSRMTYYEMTERTAQFLDTIDIERYLKRNKDIFDIMEEINNDYGQRLKDDPFFQGDVFNWMMVDEFCNYLKQRYGINIRVEEVVTYRIGELPWN